MKFDGLKILYILNSRYWIFEPKQDWRVDPQSDDGLCFQDIGYVKMLNCSIIMQCEPYFRNVKNCWKVLTDQWWAAPYMELGHITSVTSRSQRDTWSRRRALM